MTFVTTPDVVIIRRASIVGIPIEPRPCAKSGLVPAVQSFPVADRWVKLAMFVKRNDFTHQ
jgi:hypothetical protein